MGLFSEEAEEVLIKGTSLVCPVCFNKTFWKRNAQLNTPGLTFLGLDWANRSATCYVCADCTHISWFLEG
ncbi:hypothetical protein [Dyadobacter crusticola]|uniref:hypothetical protein n=1 Tax=Dyadobacter crusticola TaxID=292407 RepID=UPI0004E134B9|nr:hypothetical protein [Dyadobacter crusticola]